MNKYRTGPLATNKMPPGIPYIIGNEAAERFSFYGMRSVLLAYMTVYLANPDGTLAVLPEKEAEVWVHFFVGSAYFFPIIGGILSDAFFGKYRIIISLSMTYCLGHLCLAFMGVMGNTREWLFVGLLFIAIGSGGIKPCVSAHVGDQFCKKNGRFLSRVFGWFYFSINFGAFASGLLTPFLLEGRNVAGTIGGQVYPWAEFFIGEKAQEEILFGPHYAFGLPGVLMALATFVFWLGRNRFAHVTPMGVTYFREVFSGESLKLIGRLSIIFSFFIIFWSLFDQLGTSWQIQARSLDRMIPDWIPVLGGYELLAAQVAAVFNPLFILLLIPVFNFGVYPLIDRFFPLNPLRKISIGLFVMTLAFSIVAFVQVAVDNGETPHMGWQVLACLLLTSAEVMISITGLEFSYTQAPKAMKSFVLSLFLLTVSFGNFFTSGVKLFILNEDGSSKLPGASEFWFWTGLIGLAAVLFVFVAKSYKARTYLQDEEVGPTDA